ARPERRRYTPPSQVRTSHEGCGGAGSPAAQREDGAVLQKREQDELQQRGEVVAAAETLRSAGESAARSAEKKDEEQHVTIFWRVFGGTILSIVALAAV